MTETLAFGSIVRNQKKSKLCLRLLSIRIMDLSISNQVAIQATSIMFIVFDGDYHEIIITFCSTGEDAQRKKY